MRIGYFEHWSRPTWSFVEFLKEQGYDIEKIDYSQKGYLEKYDIALIEQNGFNDYIENDELYIREWVERGGIVFFLHQDYQRWAPYFMPHELGYTQLIHRYVPTVRLNRTHHIYMMPWLEDNARHLFNYPEKITPDEMLGWNLKVHTFNILRDPDQPDTTQTVDSAALSCYLLNPAWEILGSYMDPAVRDGALIAQSKYGKGMYFLSQILVPEVLEDSDGCQRCMDFWKKYMRNVMSHFENFRNNTPNPTFAPGEIAPDKRNYKLTIHMHSLDWYGCDSAPGTINAMMRYMDYDICAFAVKDAAPYGGKLAPQKYSDDKVLFLDGQEYHPFNWNDKNDHISHNCYHMVAVGTDHDAYTQEFTRSLFSDAEVDEYLKKSIDYAHKHNGVVVATHPWNCDYWHNYDFDGVDIEPLKTVQGTTVEQYWLNGGKIAMMVSVDLFGFFRIVDNPAPVFVYLNGEKPSRDSVVKAIREGRTIAACGFSEADITYNGALPGSTVARSANDTVHIAARADKGCIREVRIFADDKIIVQEKLSANRIEKDYVLPENDAKRFIRVELTGEDELTVAIATPFYLA